MKRVLVLGAGKHQRIEGADHQDIMPFDGINLVFDLNQQWVCQIQYDLIVAHHVCEHLKSLIHFMDNCWWALKTDGVLEIETPNAGVNIELTNCDPTHLHAYRPHSFLNYFTPEGIEKFGYTKHPWKMEVSTFQLEIPHDCIRVTATPIK